MTALDMAFAMLSYDYTPLQHAEVQVTLCTVTNAATLCIGIVHACAWQISTSMLASCPCHSGAARHSHEGLLWQMCKCRSISWSLICAASVQTYKTPHRCQSDFVLQEHIATMRACKLIIRRRSRLDMQH